MPQRDNIMIGTAGHIDHGKTRLVRLMTGCDTDTLPEEKARGLTIDLGFAPCRLQDERIVGVVDVPGHEKFIRNMVAGAMGVDLVVLVVAADDGIMPQTVEHLDVVLLLGVRYGIVAVTKTDMVTPARVAQVAEEVRGLLAPTALNAAAICPVSSETGEGFGEFSDALNTVAAQVPPREANGIFRLAVERTFTAEGFGTVATGIPCSGRVSVGDILELFDSRQRPRRVRVRRLEVYGRDAQEGLCGQCVALNLVEAEVGEVGRACVVATPGYVRPQEFLEMRLRWVDRPNVPPLKDHTEVHFHTGTMASLGRVHFLENRETLGPRESCLAQIRLAQPLVAAIGDHLIVRCQAGRSGLRVAGGGRIVGTTGQHLKRRQWTVDKLRRWESALDTPALRLAEAVRDDPMGASPQDAARRAVLPLEAAAERPERVAETRTGRWLHADRLEELCSEVHKRLEAFHHAHPQHLGQRLEELRAEVNWPNDVFDRVILEGLPEVWVQEDTWLRLTSHKPEVPSLKARQLDQIEEAIRVGGFRPPQARDLADALSLPQQEVTDLLAVSTERKAIVEVGQGLWFHRDTVARAADIVRRTLDDRGTFTTMEFRDMLGTSRKYAVPLLDYFDVLGLTRRIENRRQPGPNLDAGAGPVPPREATP